MKKVLISRSFELFKGNKKKLFQMWIKLCHWQLKIYMITKTGRSPRIVRRGSKRYQGNRDTIDKLFPSIPAGGNNPSPSQKLITDPQTGKHRCVTCFYFFRLFEVWVATFLTLNQSFSSNIHHKRRGVALSFHGLQLLRIWRNYVDFKKYDYGKLNAVEVLTGS